MTHSTSPTPTGRQVDVGAIRRRLHQDDPAARQPATMETHALLDEIERLAFLHENDHKLADNWRDQREPLIAEVDRLQTELTDMTQRKRRVEEAYAKLVSWSAQVLDALGGIHNDMTPEENMQVALVELKELRAQDQRSRPPRPVEGVQQQQEEARER